MDLASMSKEELVKLRADVDRALASVDERRRTEARAAAENAAKEYGFSLDEILKSTGKQKTKSAPKYRNPEDPRQTWTGKGRQPAWIKSGLENGRDLDDFAL